MIKPLRLAALAALVGVAGCADFDWRAGALAAANSLAAGPIYVAPPPQPMPLGPTRIVPFSCQTFGGVTRCY